jgi:light-regulated signal transduction histidine kinase (bacteriophytochrome)
MKNTFGIDILPDNDQQRIEALRRYKILDTPPEEAFDNVARLSAQIFKVPISSILLVDGEQVFQQYSGLGLGLYICSEIIKSHNGTIGVESEQGTGSIFLFILPLTNLNNTVDS